MAANYKIDIALQQLITADFAHQYRIIPIAIDNQIVRFKTDDSNPNLQNELQVVLGIDLILEQDSTENITTFLYTNYRKSVTNTIANIKYSTDFLEKIIHTAKEISSSDIHFEPYENYARIRYRLDGKLKEQFHISNEEYPIIVNKIKIKAQLDISEKRLPQDGRIAIQSTFEDFDIRVSVLPTLYGEKIVLRLLSKDSDSIDLMALGFSSSELDVYLEAIKKPNGIILISGPTGSGKTTTLYATLKKLNQPETNILTVEDPIEYTIEGVNQVQLRENIGLDFASTLRTFLRQDPDVIMVGEIRDAKTANMAIRAALTGHLVLSTIHTNSAWATISRLIDMGIPSFLIANTLNVSVAQRLVRKLCQHCKVIAPVTAKTFPMGYVTPKDLNEHHTATGCTHCYHTGYAGRKAIYEIVRIDDALIELIKNNATTIDEYLQRNKIKTLKSNALELIKNGTTSVDEVYSLLM